MHYIHYTKEFIEKIELDPKQGMIYNKIEGLKYIDKLEGLNSIDPYSRGILVLKFVKANTCRIIIEPRWIEVGNNKIHVLFVRDYISKKSFDYFWGNIVHPQLTSGEWLSLHPLSEDEIQKFEQLYLENEGNSAALRPELPVRLVQWLDEFKIKLDFDIFERESWVLYSSDRSAANGLPEKYILLFRDTIKAILNPSSNPKVIITELDHDYSVYSAVFETFNIGIIFSDFRDIGGKRIIVLHDGAHLKDQQIRWAKALKTIYQKDGPVHPDILNISKDAFRAYPKWIVTAEGDELWNAIQRFDGSHNLSLLPEQVSFLTNFKFPAYINGQAGSGKSTMLYYLFANVYFYKAFDQIDGDIIFLTENDHLLEHTSQEIIGLISSNPEFSIGFTIEQRHNVRKHFQSFKTYLLNILPEEEREQFSEAKFLDFAIFKELFNSNQFVSKKFSAEEIWFVVSTYVFGYFEDKVIDTVEKYLDEIEGIPSKFRIVDPETFQAITSNYLGFYKKLLEDGYWDKIRLVRSIRKFYPNFLPRQYAVVFCDEAQDFSRIELRLIIQSCLFTTYDLSNVDQVPIVFAGDALQTVSPTGFSDTRLHQMYYDAFNDANFKYNKSRSTYNPEFNYRSSQPIVRLANVVQNYRRDTLHEDIFIKQESKRALERAPIPVLHSKEWLSQPENYKLFSRKFKYKSFIVPIDLNEEHTYVKNDYLLSKEEFTDIKSSIDAKGAEYSQVVVYGFGEQHLKEFGQLSWDAGIHDFKKRFFFNKLYVAVTRAQNELIIVDSEEAISGFWVPLLTIPPTIEKWEDFSDINDLLPINPKTGLLETLESTPDDALANATQDMEQGIYDGNIGRLVVASNVFLMLGKVEEAHYCLGQKERIRQNWIPAGEHFLKAGKVEEAGDSFFRAQAWTLLNEKTKGLAGAKQEARLLVSHLLQSGTWPRENLSKVYSLRNIVTELMSGIDWYVEYSNKLIDFANSIKNSEEKRELAYILESIVKEDDEDLWLVIGRLYFDTKQFTNAIDAWGRIVNEQIVAQYFPDYIKANIEKANDEDNHVDRLLWTGRLIDSDISQGERVSLSKALIKQYDQFSQQVINSAVYIEIVSSVYQAASIIGDFDVLNTLCPVVESKAPSKDWIVRRYERMIQSCTNEFISGYLKERWAYCEWQLLDIADEVEKLAILNKRFLDNNFCFDDSNGEWYIDEIVEIPKVPGSVKIIPDEHFKRLSIKNFRGFEELKVDNLGLLNIIVGNNNSGKTSLLEAFLFSPDPDICLGNFLYTINQRNNNSQKERAKYYTFLSYLVNKRASVKEIEYTLYNGRRSWTYTLRHPSEKELKEVKDVVDADPRLFLGIKEKRSKIAISQKIEHITFDMNDVDFIKKIPFIPFGKGYSDKLSAIYYSEIGSKKSLREEFLAQMRTFIPNIIGISINPETDSIVIEENDSGAEVFYSLHDYGEGANKLFRILVQLHASKGRRLMIDEIDAGIHYSRFLEFLRVILKTAIDFNVQIFATTHNAEWIDNLISVLREESDSAFQQQARIITLEKHYTTQKIVPIVRDFPGVEFAYENKVELRGRKV